MTRAGNVVVGAPRFVPLTGTDVGGCVVLALMGGACYEWRQHIERSMRPRQPHNRLLVFGTGEGGMSIVTALLRNPASPYLPVGLLDGDLSKQRLKIAGVPVLGTRGDMAGAARRGDDAARRGAEPRPRSGTGLVASRKTNRALYRKPEAAVNPVGGLHLTGVARVGGSSSRGRPQPEIRGRVPGLVPHRCRLPGLP